MGSLTSKSSLMIKNSCNLMYECIRFPVCECVCVRESIRVSVEIRPCVGRSANLSCQLMEPVLQMECCL